MKKFIITLAIFLASSGLSVEALVNNNLLAGRANIKVEKKSPAEAKTNVNLDAIGFHKRLDIPNDVQIRKIFEDYEKYTNDRNIDGFVKLHDEKYKSADGYDITRLKQLAIESWEKYPDVKYSIKVLSVNVDIDNAIVITNENLSGITDGSIDYIKGKGDIQSDSTAIYYLKRFSNEWKIVSDFIINEKTSLRFGVARFIPMMLDAPAIASADEDYTAVIKMNIPRNYIALVSLTNEPITYPMEKSTEVFRGMKSDGIRERILHTNNDSKNENAIASIAIAQPDISNDMINIHIAGIAFLSSRVNVHSHKFESNWLTDIIETPKTEESTANND